jgi:hypothetical protein
LERCLIGKIYKGTVDQDLPLVESPTSTHLTLHFPPLHSSTRPKMRFSLSLSAIVGLLAFTGLAAARNVVTFDGPAPCQTCVSPECKPEDYPAPSILRKVPDSTTALVDAKYTDDNKKVVLTVNSSASRRLTANKATVESKIATKFLVTLENTPKRPSSSPTYFVIAPQSTCTLDLVQIGYVSAYDTVATMYEKGATF